MNRIRSAGVGVHDRVQQTSQAPAFVDNDEEELANDEVVEETEASSDAEIETEDEAAADDSDESTKNE